MKYWEFLIQKEGDQTWLPLETQQVEILEGRYRVVAHTDRANTPVGIRVSQLITDEVPPRQRVRKRTSSTNESGLVVVMPFVHLQPGQWKLKCSSVDAVGDMLGESWQYGVQLQVFAQTEEDWSSEWPVPEDEPSVVGDSADEADSEAPLVNADLPLLQAKAELRQIDGAQADEENSDDTSQAASELAYQVLLRQQAYLSQRDRPMTIVGKVRSLGVPVDEATSQLWIRLQNPQTAGVIMEAHRPLSLAKLPADFKVQIQLPNEVQTRVVLGEVSLRTAAIDGERSAQVLASTAFTITAGIDQILDAIANQDPGTFEEEISLLSSTSSAGAESVREPAVPSFDSSQKTVVPVGGTVLPPQLEPRVESDRLAESLEALPTQVGSSLIDLPTFEQAAFEQSMLNQTLVEPSDEQTVSDSAIAPVLPVETDREVPSEEPAIDDLSERSALADDDEFLPTANVLASEEETEIPKSVFDRPAVQPVQRPPMVASPAQFVGTSIEDSDLEADEIAAALDDIDKDLLDEPSELDALEAPGIEGVVESISRTSRAAEAARLPDSVPSSPAVSAAGAAEPSGRRLGRRKSGREVEASLAFQSLKMKDHFWQRLSALNRQSHEEATKIAENMDAAGVSRGDGFSSLAPMSSALEGYADDEVVIYEEPPVTEQPVSDDADIRIQEERTVSSRESGRYGDPQANLNALIDGSKAATESSSVTETGLRPLAQSVGQGDRLASTGSGFSQGNRLSGDDLPEVALPVISLPMGDLVAGQTVTVTVRSRPSTYKPFIKIWMVDRQSRSLVIEPKILTNLLPDALGDLQGTTELLVPMDCLDVQIAAIAIDMATQQESGKAVVNRRVVPANQPSARGGFKF